MVIQICLQIWSSPHLTSKTFSELWEFYICSLPPQSQTGAEKKKQSRERKWTKNFFGGAEKKKTTITIMLVISPPYTAKNSTVDSVTWMWWTFSHT